jgi:tellurite resistance protein TehA-like permease
MSEDTGTSITSGQDPVYTTSLTSTIGRPPRKVYFWIQTAVLVATLGLCWLSRSFKEQFEQAEMKDLSSLTTLMMRVGELLTTPIGFGCAISIVLGLGLLAIKGAIDGLLKLLIWLNVLWLIAFIAFHTVGIWMPLLKAKQAAGH